jgi:hypothetical protein
MNSSDDANFPSIAATGTAQLGFDGPLAVQLTGLCEKLLLTLCHNVPPRKRERYEAAITLIAEFFKCVGFPTPICLELVELAHALRELDRGTVRDFLKPSTASNHPVDPSDVWQARAQFAIVVEQLMQGDLSEREAARRVIKAVPQIKMLMRSGSKNPEATLLDWHKRLANNTVKEPIATSAWRDREQLIDSYRMIIAAAQSRSHSPLKLAVVIAIGALSLVNLARGKRAGGKGGDFTTLQSRIERVFDQPAATKR